MPSIPVPSTSAELLARMISFDTVNRRVDGHGGTETELTSYLEQIARAWGFVTKRLPIDDNDTNLLVYGPPAPGAPTLLFDSHLDTVSVDGMTIDPFAARIHQGRLYGRGACDTKGSGAAMLWALKRLSERRAPFDQPANVAILFSVDEEVAMTGVLAFVRKQMPELDWRPNAVVVGEPTEMQIVAATGGIARWSIRTRGVAAHSSNPAKGRSAISAMMKVIDALETSYIPNLDANDPLVGRAQCSINLISGGTQINVIPETCEIHVDRRVVPGEDPAGALPDVEAILDALRARHDGLEVEQGAPRLDPPLEPALSRQFSEKVGSVLTRHGLNPQPIGVPYGTNASKYAAAGIPAIVMGPGCIDQAHTAEEWIALDQLELSEKVYFDLMCGASQCFE